MATDHTQSVSFQPLDDGFYIESSLPMAMTIMEYRLSRPRRPSVWRRLRSGLRTAPTAGC